MPDLRCAKGPKGKKKEKIPKEKEKTKWGVPVVVKPKLKKKGAAKCKPGGGGGGGGGGDGGTEVTEVAEVAGMEVVVLSHQYPGTLSSNENIPKRITKK